MRGSTEGEGTTGEGVRPMARVFCLIAAAAAGAMIIAITGAQTVQTGDVSNLLRAFGMLAVVLIALFGVPRFLSRLRQAADREGRQ
ncbi:MAG: hypothetical protein AAGA26_06175 [Pseudomonadota bacterium]